MSDNYAATVLYKADIEREQHNRATGVDAEDYVLVDFLCAELNRCLGVDCSSFQDLRFKHIKNDACIPIISRYIPQFANIGFALELITQQFWRKGNKECSNFLERWTVELKANGRLSKIAENTLDNAFVKIQDKSKQDFLVGLICEKDAFPFTMEMLGRWKIEAALPIIIERLEVDTIKTSAITALGKYKDTSLLPYIEPFINSVNAGEREAATRAVRQIKNLRIP
mgnify:CR=1 FL=1